MSTERKHSTVRWHALAVLMSFSLSVAGCLDLHHEEPVPLNKCTACHGDANRVVGPDAGVLQAAPPFDLNGDSDPKFRGVGAHQNHLTESFSHNPVACTECHVVPKLDDIFSNGHFDSSTGAQITFGDLAKAKGYSPTYDYNNASCSNTYCHQSIVATNNPVWQAPRDSAAACGSCHGLPPAAPHPQNSDCSKCHGAVVDANGNFVNKSLHINGNIDTGTACNSCHGIDPKTGGPPPDLEGNTDSQYPGVGAHANHLQASATHSPVACSECHVVPTIDTPGHIDGAPPASVTFGTLATSGNSSPIFNATGPSCSGTYCHQAYNPANNPNWTAPLDSTAACGTCHGLPPPFVADTPISAQSHPKVNSATDCYRCHGMVVDSKRNFTAPELHVNGNIEYQLTCSSCHGSSASPAPPTDLSGNTDVTSLGVGAHQAHLTGISASFPTGSFRPVLCSDCHTVPTDVNDPNHINDWTTAVLTFSGAAVAGNQSPSWNSPSSSPATCTGGWCHGPGAIGNVSPVWNDPSVTLSCTSCHGFPPPFVANTPISTQSHPKVNNATDCYRCHGTVIDSNLNFVAPQLHVNGTIDYQLTCSSCHGDTSRSGDDLTNAAPPMDLSGHTDVASLGVGAHQAHLTGISASFPTASFRPVLCSDCHTVPTDVNDPGHINDWTTAVAPVFSGVAIAGGQSPSWNSQTATCTSGWCHGPGTLGNVSPVWNDPSVTLSCNSCHGFPPATPHPQLAQCNACHTNVTAGNAFIDPTKHANGSVDF